MTYEINIAKRNPKQIGKIFGPHYLHYMLCDLGSCFEADAKFKFKEVCAKYPYPEFRCTLSRRESYTTPLVESGPLNTPPETP